MDKIVYKTFELKTVLLGESGVGKTSIALRFSTDVFKKYNESTIGASYLTKNLYIDNNIYKFFIWDTAGQEKYHSLAPMYYRGASLALIVYDITNKNTFLTVQKWVNELKKNGPLDIMIAIIGNKVDLSDKRQVPTEHARLYAQKIDALFLETSAKDNINIHELFKNAADKVPIRTDIDLNDNVIKIYNIDNKKNKNYICC